MAIGTTNAVIGSNGVDVLSGRANIPSYAFANTNITSFTNEISSTMDIGNNVFQDCLYLIKAYLANGLASNQYTFSGCINLESVYMGGSGQLGQYTFDDCYKLKKIALASTSVVSLVSTRSSLIPTNTPRVEIYVPSNLISNYQTATNWSTRYNNGDIVFKDIANWSD